MNPPRRTRHAGCIAALAAGLLWGISSAAASPPEGSNAPPILLKDLGGESVSTARLAPRTLVLIFGDLDHEGARKACGEVLDALADPRLEAANAVPILIIAKDKPLVELKTQAQQFRLPPIILNDPQRDAFGAYRILVLPTVVVVDGQGKVVHAMPGFLQGSREVLSQAVLVAAGKQTPEQLQQSLDPKPTVVDHETVRADRMVHLGAELTRHQLYELAEAKYSEALALVPGHVGAKLGLGELMLRQNRPADAEPLFRSVLSAKPDSVDAALGIADAQIRRGGDELPKAEAGVKGLVEKDPKLPRAHFLLGQIKELKGDSAGALTEYKKVAELLLDR